MKNTVRAVYRAAKIPGRQAPYDNLTLKLHYPCRYGDSFEERDTGFVPADPSRSPFPIVILMPGINISPDAYGWLARKLARAGFLAVTYSWVTVEMGDRASLSPGVDVDSLRRENYGQAPSCPPLPAILQDLAEAQQQGLLAGHLDLDRVVLGGHSAGGSMALLNANASWFPALRGAFAYAAHTAGNVRLGWPADSFMPLADDLPLLLMGGTRDGVIAASGHRYGREDAASASAAIERTFATAVRGERGDRYLLVVEGANHFAFAWPVDKSTGRAYLDGKAAGGKKRGKKIRRYLGDVAVTFCQLACRGGAASATALQTLCETTHPLAAIAQRK